VREYLIVFAVAALATFLLTPLAALLAVRIGAMAQVRDRDVHATPTPRLGGVAMYGGVLAGMIVASRLPLLSTVFSSSSEPKAVILAGGMICALGVVDDRWSLDPLSKLAGQIAAAGVMVLLGVQLSFIFVGTHLYSLGQAQAVPLTVLLSVVLVNAVNFIDGLDGLAAGVVAISALAAFVYGYHITANFGYYTTVAAPATLLAAVLAGVCVGFLPHNFSPARLFMGDSGSMLIGLMLAGSVTSLTGQLDSASLDSLEKLPLLVPLALPLAVLAVPLTDFLFAIIRRTRSGRSPFTPDKRHLHHRLLGIGHSQRRAVLLIYAWTALLASCGVALSFSNGAYVALALLLAVLVLGIVVSSLPRWRALRRPLP
jgi:UDP-GlcNAc:undecaprenyl-phosphate GlcNAc-1-phosphate transferase